MRWVRMAEVTVGWPVFIRGRSVVGESELSLVFKSPPKTSTILLTFSFRIPLASAFLKSNTLITCSLILASPCVLSSCD